MADLIEFPYREGDPQLLPKPGDEYLAFAPPVPHPQFMLAFVFPGGLMTSYRFSDLGRMGFTPDSGSGDGIEVIDLRFSWKWANQSATVRVEGRNLFSLYTYLSDHQTRWLRVLPPGRHVKDPELPVITRIVLLGHDD